MGLAEAVVDNVEAQLSPLPTLTPQGLNLRAHLYFRANVLVLPKDSNHASRWSFFEGAWKRGHLPHVSELTGPEGAQDRGCFHPGSGGGLSADCCQEPDERAV